MDTNVTINLFYILGLLGFSLLMAGLYLSALAANQRQAQDHGITARHLHTEVAYFTDRFATQRRESHRLKDALARAEADLSTSHAHVSSYLEELDRLKAANLATVKAYNDLANEYAWFRSLVASKDAPLYQYALTTVRKIDVPFDLIAAAPVAHDANHAVNQACHSGEGAPESRPSTSLCQPEIDPKTDSKADLMQKAVLGAMADNDPRFSNHA